MKNMFKGTRGDTTIISLLVIVAILGIIFFIRVNISVNNTPGIGGVTAPSSKTHEAELFNIKFNTYQGMQVGKPVKAMIIYVNKSNLENDHKISIVYNGKKYNEDILDLSTLIEEKLSYNVKITKYSEEGYIETITVENINI